MTSRGTGVEEVMCLQRIGDEIGCLMN